MVSVTHPVTWRPNVKFWPDLSYNLFLCCFLGKLKQLLMGSESAKSMHKQSHFVALAAAPRQHLLWVCR